MNRDEVASVMLKAGVRRWWGDGLRPLNMPAAVPVSQWRAVREADEARRIAVIQGPVSGLRDTGTIVLEPTPSQIERGQRVIEIGADDAYAPVARLRDLAVLHGWSALISQSRYLTEPSNLVEASRRARRLEKVVQALRIARGPVRAWAAWEFDVEKAAWSAQGGQSGLLTPDGTAVVARVDLSVTQFEVLITGVVKERKATAKEKKQ